MKKNYYQIHIFLIISLIFVIFDRLLKFLAVKGFFEPPIRLVGDIFSLDFAANKYISFSIPLHGSFLTLFISAIIIALLYSLIYYTKKGERTYASLLMLVFFGAMSNLVDRLRYGFVIDYLDLKYFTVFNIADAMIVVGVLFLVWLVMKKEKMTSR